MDKQALCALVYFCTVKTWCASTGMAPSTFYEELKLGHLRAVKLRGRTLVDCPHGLTYLNSLPPVQARPARTKAA